MIKHCPSRVEPGTKPVKFPRISRLLSEGAGYSREGRKAEKTEGTIKKE